jgi:carboxymethylenebutenolidase
MVAIATQHVTLTVSDGTTMPAYVARPDGGSRKGLIVFQEAFGVNHHIRDVAERFAREGYLAIAPALFHRTDPAFECGYDDFSVVMPHMGALSTESLAADAAAAYDWLQAANAPEIAAIGYCLGGRSAFIANASLNLKAAVSYYGGGIAAGLLDSAADLHAPHLLVWGGLDKHIGAEQRRAAADALAAAGKTFIEINFGFADHGFFCDERAAYNANAAGQAWALTLAFLSTYVKG